MWPQHAYLLNTVLLERRHTVHVGVTPYSKINAPPVCQEMFQEHWTIRRRAPSIVQSNNGTDYVK